MASEAVLKFLEDHNRPFSANDIQQGAKGEFGKAAIQKALDALVAKDKVKEKVYGKQKVYCIIQKTDCSAAELRENVLEVDRKTNEVTLQLKEVTDNLKNKSALIAQLKGKMTLEEALDQKASLEKELEEVKHQLEGYSDTIALSPTVMLEVEKNYEKYLCEYKKRKRLCMDIVNKILENYPKSKKHLFEDIGMETDEDAGFSLDPV